MQTLYSENEIESQVFRLACKITDDLIDQDIHELVIIGVLNGSFIFTSDLVRALYKVCHVNKHSLELETIFIKASSYKDDKSTGQVSISDTVDLQNKIKDKFAVVVEDIIDTGLTIRKIFKHLSSYNPKNLKLCSLLNKPCKRIVVENEQDIVIDYPGFTLVEDLFVVGYGLDYNEKYRELPNIRLFNSREDENDATSIVSRSREIKQQCEILCTESRNVRSKCAQLVKEHQEIREITSRRYDHAHKKDEESF